MNTQNKYRTLLGGVLVFAAVISVTSARAESCSHSSRNYQRYLDNCQASGDCRRRQYMETLKSNACGSSMNVPVPVPVPTPAWLQLEQRPLSNDSRQRDCRDLTAKFQAQARAFHAKKPGEENNRAMDLGTLELMRQRAEQACGHPIANEDRSSEDICPELVRFRDNELPDMWSLTTDKLAIFEDGLKDLQTLRTEMENDAFWVGEWREIANHILQPLDAAGKLFENLLYMNPTTARYVAVSKIIRKVPGMYLQVLKRAKKIHSITTAVKDEFGIVLGEIIADELKKKQPGVAAMKAVYDLQKDIRKMKNLPANFRQVRGEIVTRIDALNKQIGELQIKIRTHSRGIEKINKIREAIDRRCSSR